MAETSLGSMFKDYQIFTKQAKCDGVTVRLVTMAKSVSFSRDKTIDQVLSEAWNEYILKKLEVNKCIKNKQP